MTKIVSLSGEPIQDPRVPDPDIVKFAEWLVEAARSGEIRGLAIAYHYADDSGGHNHLGWASHSMIGRLHAVQNQMAEALNAKFR